MRTRISGGQLRALAKMVDQHSADGYIVIETEYVHGWMHSESHQRIAIDLQVDPKWNEWAAFYDERDRTYAAVAPPSPKDTSDPVKERYKAALEYLRTTPPQFTLPPRPPPPDCGPAMDLFAAMVKSIVKAWAEDDTSKRFRMLELD